MRIFFRRTLAAFATIIAFCSLVNCNQNTTDDLLTAKGINGKISLSETTATMSVNTSRTFTVSGGRAPFTSKVLGSGSATITDKTLTYSAGSLIDNVSINITDSAGSLATLSIDVVGVAQQPTEISGAALWLKADSLSLADNATVTTWSDSSGNARDFSGGGGAVFRTSFINGQPAVSFNGTSHYLSRASDANLNPSTFTFFVLHYPEVIPGTGAIPPYLSKNDAGGLSGYYFYVQSNTYGAAFYGATSSPWVNLNTQNAVTINTWYLSEMRIDGTIFTYHQNAILQGQLSMAGRPFLRNLSKPQYIAAADTNNFPTAPTTFYTGKVAEIILFNRALSAGEVQGVRCYLNKKYALGFGC